MHRSGKQLDTHYLTARHIVVDTLAPDHIIFVYPAAVARATSQILSIALR